MGMACDFGHGVHTVARVPGPAFGHQMAYCSLLPRAQFPPFPDGQGEPLPGAVVVGLPAGEGAGDDRTGS